MYETRKIDFIVCPTYTYNIMYVTRIGLLPVYFDYFQQPVMGILCIQIS